jgi:transcriptional regulator with PAS, ATPase and Fis domain
MQAKLLRVLETGDVTRVGSSDSRHVDVRVIAATNRPLRTHVEEGKFRSDLYYRLNVLSIYLPPLRERPSDIPLLVRRFIRDLSAQHDLPFPGLSADAMRLLVESALKPAGGLVGAGFDEFRWPRPVRPGDELRVESEVLEVRASKSRPGQGLVKVRMTTLNQDGDAVQVLVANIVVPRRPSA